MSWVIKASPIIPQLQEMFSKTPGHFEVEDRVRINPAMYNEINNALFNMDRSGYIGTVGYVSEDRRSGRGIHVEWDHGQEGDYKPEWLEHV